MLYIGNFNYDDANDSAENYCLMPVVVEAQDPEEALSKIAELFQRLHETSDLLDGACEIYLDSLIELEQNPTEPILTQWTKIVPSVDGLSLINSVLPMEKDAQDGIAEAYSWFGEGEGPSETDEDLEEFSEDDPFLILE